MMYLLLGVLIGATAVGVYDIVTNYKARARARIFSMYLNPGYATALCSASRNALTQQDPPYVTFPLEGAYKDWIEKSEAAWAERAERHEAMRQATVMELRKSLGLPSWDGVAVEAKSLLIPAPEIFTQQEVSNDHHSDV